MAKKPNQPVHTPAQRTAAPASPQTISMQQWQGPLPPPGALAQFDQIVDGGAERIFSMVEREQAHRIEHEKTKLEAAASDFRWGQILGFVLGLACVAAAVYTAKIGAHPTVSIALVGLPIAAAIKAFLRK